VTFLMRFLEEIRNAVTGLLGRIGIDGKNLAVAVAFGVVSFFGTIALTGAVLVRLPPDFVTNESPKPPDRSNLRARAALLLRHLLGVLLILLGLVLMLPGVPGQGLLTVIAGLFISELPGTNRLLRWLLRGPRALSAVNKLRARYKHPPLEAPREAPPPRPDSPPPG
jgi:hypothetical protein